MDGATDNIILPPADLGDMHALVGDARQHLRHANAAILLAFEDDLPLPPSAVEHLHDAQTKIGRAITELQEWDTVKAGDADVLAVVAGRR